MYSKCPVIGGAQKLIDDYEITPFRVSELVRQLVDDPESQGENEGEDILLEKLKALLERGTPSERVIQLLTPLDVARKDPEIPCPHAAEATSFVVDLSEVSRVNGAWKEMVGPLREAIESKEKDRALLIELPQHLFPKIDTREPATFEEYADRLEIEKIQWKQHEEVRAMMYRFIGQLQLALAHLAGVDQKEFGEIFEACIQRLECERIASLAIPATDDRLEVAAVGPPYVKGNPRKAPTYALFGNFQSDLSRLSMSHRGKVSSDARDDFMYSELCRMGWRSKMEGYPMDQVKQAYMAVVSERCLPTSRYLMLPNEVWICTGESISKEEGELRALQAFAQHFENTE